MSFWDYRRSPASVRLIVDFGRDRGIAPGPLLASSGLSPQQLDDPNADLSATQELQVIANLLRLTGNPSRLGLELGLRYHFSSYGIWGYGLISSATVVDALKLAMRFVPLTYAFTQISFHEDARHGVLTFEEPALGGEMKRFLVERDMAAASVLMHELMGPDMPIARLSFRAPEPRRVPKTTPSVHSLLGIDAIYGAASNTIALDAAVLPRKLPQANPVTAAMCHQICGELLERRRERTGRAAVIRQLLTMPADDWPDLAAMAKRFSTSERTLKRQLHSEGTSFRALLEEARQKIADELLVDTSLSITEIAARLGFADLSSFSQAYKRWHGVPPRKKRDAA